MLLEQHQGGLDVDDKGSEQVAWYCRTHPERVEAGQHVLGSDDAVLNEFLHGSLGRGSYSQRVVCQIV